MKCSRGACHSRTAICKHRDTDRLYCVTCLIAINEACKEDVVKMPLEWMKGQNFILTVVQKNSADLYDVTCIDAVGQRVFFAMFRGIGFYIDFAHSDFEIDGTKIRVTRREVPTGS